MGFVCDIIIICRSDLKINKGGENMTDQEILQAMQEMIQPIREDITSMKTDIASLKKTAALVENDIAPKVQILLENHSDLTKNVMFAKDIEERVGTLEFEMRVVKNILKSKPI